MAKLTCPDCGIVNLEAGAGCSVSMSPGDSIGCRCGYQYSAEELEAFQRQLQCTLCHGEGTVKSPYSSNAIRCPGCNAQPDG